jgi:hypothetical protein
MHPSLKNLAQPPGSEKEKIKQKRTHTHTSLFYEIIHLGLKNKAWHFVVNRISKYMRVHTLNFCLKPKIFE